MQPLQSHPETWTQRPQDPKEWPGLLLWVDREEAHSLTPRSNCDQEGRTNSGKGAPKRKRGRYRDLCNLLVKNKGFGVRQLWLKVLAWPQASCVTLSKLFTLAEPLLAHSKMKMSVPHAYLTVGIVIP